MPSARDAKLLSWMIVLPSADDVSALRTNLALRGVAIADEPNGLLLADPWGTSVRVCA